jgi:cell wall-associated NlpC family hydrolase
MTHPRRTLASALAAAALAATTIVSLAPAVGATPAATASRVSVGIPEWPSSPAAVAAAQAAWGESDIADLAATALRQQAAIESWRLDPVHADRFVERDPELGTLVAEHEVTRQQLAAAVAPAAGVSADELAAAWARTSEVRRTVLFAALSQVGVPYRSMRSEPGQGFDCSGLTLYAWGTVGVELPHQDSRQMRASVSRDWATAQPADLVQYPGHVMMYLGAGKAVVHSPYTGRDVEVRTMERSVRVASPIG